MDIPMRISGLPLLAMVVSATLCGAISLAAATTYAAPENYPNKQGEYEQAYVTTRVNVRAEPGVNSRVVNRLKRGHSVNVGECRGSWCFVDAYGGNGWISGRFIGRGENPYYPNRPVE